VKISNIGRWIDDVRMDFGENWWKDEYLMHLRPLASPFKYGNEHSGSIKTRKFLD
jgi:hypothetical protein